MKKYTILVLWMVCSITTFAQYQKMLGVLEDTETEMNEGKLTLHFSNALNGEAVPDAALSIPDVGDFTSDLDGKVLFDKIGDGVYPFTFSKDGFISAKYSFEVVAGTIFFNRFSVSPRMEMGCMRIVLDWGKKPADLDLHLVKEHAYHISYRNQIKSDDGTVVLDRDDTDGFGPETVTINQTDNQASYTCYVHDYSNMNAGKSDKLSQSKATLRVYNNNQLMETYTVPFGLTGNKWIVFQLNAGQIQSVHK
jgi:hypothetical protein